LKRIPDGLFISVRIYQRLCHLFFLLSIFMCDIDDLQLILIAGRCL
jgi:hypothetical protein